MYNQGVCTQSRSLPQKKLHPDSDSGSSNDRGLTYRERLKKLGLTTPETRRLCGDMIEVFKIFKSFDDVKVTDFFTLSSTGLRGHELKLYKPQAHLDIRKKNFSQSELLMSGIACLRQYCTVIHYQHFLKTRLLFKESRI